MRRKTLYILIAIITAINILICYTTHRTHNKKPPQPIIKVDNTKDIKAGHVVIAQEEAHRPKDIRQANNIVKRIEKKKYSEITPKEVEKKKHDYIIQKENKNYYINEDKRHQISVGMAYINNVTYPNISYSNKRIRYDLYTDKRLKHVEGVGVNYIIKRW